MRSTQFSHDYLTPSYTKKTALVRAALQKKEDMGEVEVISLALHALHTGTPTALLETGKVDGQGQCTHFQTQLL